MSRCGLVGKHKPRRLRGVPGYIDGPRMIRRALNGLQKQQESNAYFTKIRMAQWKEDSGQTISWPDTDQVEFDDTRYGHDISRWIIKTGDATWVVQEACTLSVSCVVVAESQAGFGVEGVVNAVYTFNGEEYQDTAADSLDSRRAMTFPEQQFVALPGAFFRVQLHEGSVFGATIELFGSLITFKIYE